MILVAIPYHPAKRYALKHVMDWLEQQTYQDIEVVMRCDTGDYGRPGAIKLQFERLRQCATNNIAISHMYIMEADTIPPLDILSKLLAHDKDIVGALYRYRSPDKPIVAWPKERITKGLVEVEGMGTGAVLLSRQALCDFSFYDWPQTDCDYPMYDALKAKGHKVYLDCDQVCKHYINHKEYA
jgi:hypothetical protein